MESFQGSLKDFASLVTKLGTLRINIIKNRNKLDNFLLKKILSKIIQLYTIVTSTAR